MANKPTGLDQPVLGHIHQLVEKEHRLFEKGEHGSVSETDRKRLENLQVELVNVEICYANAERSVGRTRPRSGTGPSSERGREVRAITPRRHVASVD